MRASAFIPAEPRALEGHQALREKNAAARDTRPSEVRERSSRNADAFTTGGRAERHAAFWEGRRVDAAAWRYLHDQLQWAGYELVDEARP